MKIKTLFYTTLFALVIGGLPALSAQNTIPTNSSEIKAVDIPTAYTLHFRYFPKFFTLGPNPMRAEFGLERLTKFCLDLNIHTVYLSHAAGKVPETEQTCWKESVSSIQNHLKTQGINVLDKTPIQNPVIMKGTESAPLTQIPLSVRAEKIKSSEQNTRKITPVIEVSDIANHQQSSATRAWAALTGATLGLTEFILDYHDNMSDGLVFQKTDVAALQSVEPRLNAVRRLNPQTENAQGVTILASDDSPSKDWHNVLTILGISTRMVNQISADSLVAISANAIRPMSRAQIEKILSGTVLLDAQAVKLLTERGFGDAIGVKSCSWAELEETGYAYEQIRPNPVNKIKYGLETPRMTAQRLDGPILNIVPDSAATIYTDIHHFSRKVMFPGLISYRNRAGGVILSACYGIGRGQFWMGYFNAFRRILMQDVIRSITPNIPALMVGEYPIHTGRIKVKDGTLLTFSNASHDPQSKIYFRAAGLNLSGTRILSASGSWEPVKIETDKNGMAVLNIPLPPLDIHYLFITD